MTLINQGKICAYCGKPTEYIDSGEVYRKSYGMIYICRPCEAWVGVHKGTDKALGRVANDELRFAKKEAHYWFDPIWMERVNQGISKQEARNEAYEWLSCAMKLPRDICHIGMFDVSQCELVVELCQKRK